MLYHAMSFYPFGTITVLYRVGLVLKPYLLIGNRGIANDLPAVKLLTVHINSRDLMIVVSGIIVNSLVRVAAACVKSYLVFAAAHIAAAALLVNGIQYVEKLTHAFLFGLTRNGVHLHKRHPYKSRLRRQIPRQSHTPHSAAVAA